MQSPLAVETYTGTTISIFHTCQDQILHRSIPIYWQLWIILIEQEKVEAGYLRAWSDMEVHQ